MKLLYKLRHNLMSLINLVLNLVLIITITNIIGVSEESDIYFASVTILSFLLIFSRFSYSSVKNFFVLHDKELSLSVVAICILIVTSVGFLVGVGYVYFSFDTNQLFMVAYLSVLPLLALNDFFKLISIQLGNITSCYFVDMLPPALSITALVFFDFNLYNLVFAQYISLIISISLLIRFIGNCNHSFNKSSFSFYFKEVLPSSAKISIGGMFFKSKDLFVVPFLMGFGSGTYTLYSYAMKFISIIFQVVNAPINLNFSYFMGKKMADDSCVRAANKKILIEIKRIHKILLPVYLICIITFSFLSKIGLEFLLKGSISETHHQIFLIFFFILGWQYLFISVEGPLVTYLSFKKKFDLILFVNIINALFFFFMVYLSYIFNFINDNAFVVVILMALSQVINVTLYLRAFLYDNKQKH